MGGRGAGRLRRGLAHLARRKPAVDRAAAGDHLQLVRPLRKTAALGALEGLALETLLLFPLACAYLVMLTLDARNSFVGASTTSQLLLVAAGPITAIPLLLFAAGARRIPLSLLGLLQYIGPTLQLLLGVWLYREPFGGARLAGFALIWSALAVYSLEGLWQNWKARQTA